jgi:membrane protein DedA with SNARE-associated domain
MDLLAVFSPEQVQAWFEWGGYFILFGLLFACGLGLPLPEDIPLLLAGWFVAQGKMNLVIACVIAWCGIIGGDCVLYYFGKRYGLEITRVPFIGKHLTKERILRAEQLFDRYGLWVVGVGRMFAGIRGAMVVAAGATRFNFVKFAIADGIAALFSGGLFVWLGWLAGRKLGSIEQMRDKIKGVEHYVFGGIALVVIAFVLWLWLRKKHDKPKLSDVALEKVAERISRHADGQGVAHGDNTISAQAAAGHPDEVVAVAPTPPAAQTATPRQSPPHA